MLFGTNQRCLGGRAHGFKVCVCACSRVLVCSPALMHECACVHVCSGKKSTYLRWAEDHSTIMDQTDKQEGTGDGTERHGSNDTPRVVHIGVAYTGKFLDANRR